MVILAMKRFLLILLAFAAVSCVGQLDDDDPGGGGGSDYPGGGEPSDPGGQGPKDTGDPRDPAFWYRIIGSIVLFIVCFELADRAVRRRREQVLE